MEHLGDKIPDSSSDKCIQEADSNTAPRDHKHLENLPPPLEVLTHHQGRGVEDHPDPQPDHKAVADEDLVPLGGERGEETAEGGDQAPRHRHQPRGLPPAHRDDHRGEQERHGGGERPQPLGVARPGIRGQGAPAGEVGEVVEEDDGQGELEAVGEDVDQDRGQGHAPAPASLGVIMLLEGPEVTKLLVKVCDDDGLARGGEDHLHVGLGLHRPLHLHIITGAAARLE